MPADCNVILRGDKSFADDLDVQRGIVSSRVALLLRSAEIKPLLSDLFLRETLSPLERMLAGAGGSVEVVKELGRGEARRDETRRGGAVRVLPVCVSWLGAF